MQVYMTEEHLVIVMEYASGGTLEQRIEAAGPLPEEKARDLFLQLVSALEYCHSRRSVHTSLPAAFRQRVLDSTSFRGILDRLDIVLFTLPIM